MNELFPIFLKLDGRKALVVGGGEIATLRVKQLIRAKALVTVIAPNVSPELEAFAEASAITLHRREFCRADLNAAYFLLIGATDHAATQEALADEGERRGLLYNVVDRPEHCNFYTPAVVERGDLKIAICTDGQSPVLSGRLRRELEEALPDSTGEFTALLGELREKLKLKIPGNLKRQRELLTEFIDKAGTE
jgi:precorrin-2 dehydrogenase